jgi:ribosomal-protein-alanine N-acetyltransferase
MLIDETLTVRPLDAADAPMVRRILETSEYTHFRFGAEELPRLLGHLPAVGAFSLPQGRLARVSEPSLRAFLLSNWLVPPSVWIGGFGVTWSEGERFNDYLDLLLPPLFDQARARGARTCYYSGNDLGADWLRATLEARGFRLVALLRSYDKDDLSIPIEGNRQVRVRPFSPADADGVVEVENRCFDQLWRYDAQNFREIAEIYPYFVVAEDGAGICGYQFNTVDSTTGYLVRIAVHPRVEGTGVGARLMAEAIRYFRSQKVWKIVLNTEETNTRAHALYERFGFHVVKPEGYVLGRDLAI